MVHLVVGVVLSVWRWKSGVLSREVDVSLVGR